MNRSDCEAKEDPIMLAQEQEKPVEPVPEDKQTNDTNEEAEQSKSACPADDAAPQLNGEPMNFAEDISLDQLDEKKCILDANALFCPSEAAAAPADERSAETEEVNTHAEENVEAEDKENPEKEPGETNSWYENKLAEKKAVIRERLSKLARLLEFCYPCYAKWLKRMEKIHGSPVCKLESVNHYKLNDSYPNRWKFVCRRSKASGNDAGIGNIAEESAEVAWKLEPCDAWGVHINKESELPPFILRVVKVFEEFLKQAEPDSAGNASLDSDVNNENSKEGQKWQWLLVRCNSKDELMLFVIGKGISAEAMDKLKDVYESGAGKDCNVKSLYCKTTNKCEKSSSARTVLLSGSKTLEEVVGGIKMQLAPNTNFWLSAAGAEDVAKTVADLLTITAKTVVLEVGCGIGLIGLTLASKCQQFVGVDLPAEVAEAEATCKLNNIENATFISGLPTEVISKILPILQNQETQAIINGNTSIGRDTELMIQLRRVPSLERIAMVTTLTKQSVRAILELARPTDSDSGRPFVPVHACVVDTLPAGSHAEVVILMDRMQIDSASFAKADEVSEKAEQAGVPKEAGKGDGKARPKPAAAKKNAARKNLDNPLWKEKFRHIYKRAGSPDNSYMPLTKMMKRTDKFAGKLWRPGPAARKRKNPPAEAARAAAAPEARPEEFPYAPDLREKLSTRRLNTDITKKIKEHQALLDMAQEKLCGSAASIDIVTAKQLQNMLNTVLEQTNKLQTEVARSIGNGVLSTGARYVQGVNLETVLVTTANEKFYGDGAPAYKSFSGAPPLEPSLAKPPEAAGFPGEAEGREGPGKVPEEEKGKEDVLWQRRWSEPGDAPVGKQMLPDRGAQLPAGGAKGPGDRMQAQGRPMPGAGPAVPGAGTAVPGAGRAMPGTGGTMPGIGGTMSAAGGTMSAAGRTMPGIGRTMPGIGRTMPGTGGAMPGTGRAMPGTGRAMPGTGSTMPGAGRTMPAAGRAMSTPASTMPAAVGRTMPGAERTMPGAERTMLGGERTMLGGERTMLTGERTMLGGERAMPAAGRTMPAPSRTMPPAGGAMSPANRTMPPANRTMPAANRTMPAASRGVLLLPKQASTPKMLPSTSSFSGHPKSSPEPKFPMDRCWSPRQSIRPAEKSCFPQRNFPPQKFTSVWDTSPSNSLGGDTWRSAGESPEGAWRTGKRAVPGRMFNNNEYQGSVSQSKFGPKLPQQNGPSLSGWERPFPQPTPKDVWARKPESRAAAYFQRSTMNN